MQTSLLNLLTPILKWEIFLLPFSNDRGGGEGLKTQLCPRGQRTITIGSLVPKFRCVELKRNLDWKERYQCHVLFRFKRPAQIQEDRTMGCLCCVSGPLSVTVRTDRAAYCGGELMTVTVYVNNQSKHRILGVELELIKDTVFVASGGGWNIRPLVYFSQQSYSLSARSLADAVLSKVR